MHKQAPPSKSKTKQTKTNKTRHTSAVLNACVHEIGEETEAGQQHEHGEGDVGLQVERKVLRGEEGRDDEQQQQRHALQRVVDLAGERAVPGGKGERKKGEKRGGIKTRRISQVFENGAETKGAHQSCTRRKMRFTKLSAANRVGRSCTRPQQGSSVGDPQAEPHGVEDDGDEDQDDAADEREVLEPVGGK